MPRDLNADQEMLAQVLSLAQARAFEQAAAVAQRALDDGFEHPLLYNVIATRLEQQGQLTQAVQLLERAVTIAPSDLPARNALALCLQRVERFDEALAHVDQLLVDHPNLAFLHANRGNALISLGALGSAKLSHLRALELEPSNLAAIVALASIATSRGEHAEARSWAERALAQVPGLPDAVLSLAAADLAAGALTRAETLARQVIADPRSSRIDRARANNVLGDVLDAGGHYERAFGAYAACNESLRVLNQDRYAQQTPVRAYTRALTRALSGLPTARHAVAPQSGVMSGGTTGHVFLLGFPRSGTTLLEVLLDGHAEIVSAEEHELLVDAVNHFMSEPLDLRALNDASPPVLDGLRAAYWARVRAAGIDVTDKVFIDKHPLNTLKLPVIKALFPGARILFACRDPRDVVLSCFRRRFKMNAAMFELLTLDGAAQFYDAVMEFAEAARPALGLDWHLVRYEDVVADLPGQLSEICKYIGVAWDVRMGDFAHRARTREQATPSTAQLGRGLDSSGIGHWRRYAALFEQVTPVLERWVAHFGYKTTALTDAIADPRAQ